MNVEEEEDAEQLIKGPFTQACSETGLRQITNETGDVAHHFKSSDGLILHAFATTLGSVISVTVMLAGATEIVRTMNLSPSESKSSEFIRTHLISWILNGGSYRSTSSPHLQGLSKDLIGKMISFLDGASVNNFRTTSKAFSVTVKSEKLPFKALGRSRFTWSHQYII